MNVSSSIPQSFSHPYANDYSGRGRETWTYTTEGVYPQLSYPIDSPQLTTQSTQHQGFNRLLTQIETLESGNSRVGYFSLPGEARNTIMKAALTPGEVHIYQPISEGPKHLDTKLVFEHCLGEGRRAIKHALGGHAWYAGLPNGIAEFLFSQFLIFHPKQYVVVQIYAYLYSTICPALADTFWYKHRLDPEPIPWLLVAGSFINSLIDHVLGSPSPAAKSDPRLVPQLLATCHQAYREGHIWFYTQNIFYLPRGPISLSHQYFSTLQSHHRTLVRTIGIKFGLGDITQEDLDALDSLLIGPSKRSYDTRLSESGLFLAERCMQTWTAKLIFARSLPTLRLCRLEHRHEKLDLDGSNLKNSLKGITSGHAIARRGIGVQCSREVASFLLSVHGYVWLEVDHKISVLGWEVTRRYLSDGAWRGCDQSVLWEHERKFV